MATWHRHRGDEDDTLVIQIVGVGTVAGVNNLSTVTAVEAHVQPDHGGAITVLSASVTDAANSKVTVQLGGSSGWLATATPGRWRLSTHLTFTGNIGPMAWPEQDYDYIEVWPAV